MTLRISRRHVLTSAAATLAAPTVLRAAQAPVLVELFTSQGCSSCPAADKLIGEIKRRADVLAVSLNVDYWDYLGWRDTLARPEYSQRQYDYAKVRGDGEVYTPQIVVNGRFHAVGSNLSAVDAAIAEARQQPVSLPLKISSTQSEVIVDIPQGAATSDSTLWLMAIASEMDQKIDHGENSGKTITYHNVVRALVPAGMWKGPAVSLSLMKDAIMPLGSKACYAVLQQGKTGPVLGLARWDYTKS